MTALKTLILLTLLAVAQTGQAQMLKPTSAEQPVSVCSSLASQTSSPNNYALLQPISAHPSAVEPASSEPSGRLVQSGLLQPIQSESYSRSIPTNVQQGQSPPLKITPVSFKRGEFDWHEFRLENVGATILRGTKVLLKGPAGSLVQQVVPKPDSVDGSNVIVSVDELSPGAHSIVRIMIENPNNAFARFESIVLTGNGVQQSVPDSTVSTSVQPASGQREWGVKFLQPRTSAVGMLGPQVPARQASASRPVQGEGGVSTSSNTTLPSSAYGRSGIYPKSTETGVEFSSTLDARMSGPSRMNVGEEAEFSIDIVNATRATAKGVIVQLSIPENMKVTVLDRAAWYDGDTRKISWELTSVGMGSTEKIRYKAVFKTPGFANQAIVVGLNQTVQCTSSLATTGK